MILLIISINKSYWLFPKYSQNLTSSHCCIPAQSPHTWLLSPPWFDFKVLKIILVLPHYSPSSSCCSFPAACAPSSLTAFALALPALLLFISTYTHCLSLQSLDSYFWGRPSLVAFPEITTLTHTHPLSPSVLLFPLAFILSNILCILSYVSASFYCNKFSKGRHFSLFAHYCIPST